MKKKKGKKDQLARTILTTYTVKHSVFSVIQLASQELTSVALPIAKWDTFISNPR